RGCAVASSLSLMLLAGVCTRPSSLASSPQPMASGGATGEAAMPPVRHVFVILLENKPFTTTFGPNSPAPYLADTLVPQGALLTQYYGIGHFSLDNYLAIISGQAPNLSTQSDCGRFTEFKQTGMADYGQVIGEGCVYPASVKTLADQLTSHSLTWKGYMEDMGKDPSREAATCGHVAIGARDHTNRASRGDQYADKHNPFVYFHSIIDSPVCQTSVVPLAGLQQDLMDSATTPNFVFITPNLCHDGHDAPCVDGEPGGLVSADRFLRRWVPRILQSPAFRADGLLIVTFDEASSSDATACCNEQPGPNSKAPGGTGPGGGRIGAVLVSPFITPGTRSTTPYNHYSMLRSIEDIFSLPYLGYAAPPGLASFGPDVFTHPRMP
ncbi:MAG TPA: alkaline phosphatase family protein, partial [Gemmatimonadaceae bacterium]|nr:alkaline phosphatase family protein [Gemmatimonadaceae bacterium]